MTTLIKRASAEARAFRTARNNARHATAAADDTAPPIGEPVCVGSRLTVVAKGDADRDVEGIELAMSHSLFTEEVGPRRAPR